MRKGGWRGRGLGQRGELLGQARRGRRENLDLPKVGRFIQGILKLGC